MAIQYWLMESKPNEANIDTLYAEGTLPWTGVRDYQAHDFMYDRMRIGDSVLFCHSSCSQPGITRLAEVCSTNYLDPTQSDVKNHYHDPVSKLEAPHWMLADVKFACECVLIDLPILHA